MIDFDQERMEFELWRFYRGSQKVEGDDITRYVREMAAEMLGMINNIWLGEKDVVRLYPFSLEWLRRSRKRREGPIFYKLHSHRNGKVVYRLRDLELYLSKFRESRIIETIHF